MEKFGIKESLELIAAVELLSVSGIEIAKDGLGADDIEKAYDLVKKADVIVEGFSGLSSVDEEIKDLDQAELIQLGSASFAMIKKIASSVKAK